MITFKTLNQIVIFFTLIVLIGVESAVLFRSFDNAKLLPLCSLGKLVYGLLEVI